MSTSQKVFFKNIFGNPVCCVLRTRKLRSKLVGSIICETNYPEGARTARIGEANQASECNGELYFVLPPEQNQHGARGRKKSFFGSAAVESQKDFIFFPPVLFRFFRGDRKITKHPLESITLFRRRIIAQSQRIIAFSRKRIKRLRIHGFAVYF